MEYRKLGNSGLKVSEIGLGGNPFGWWADEATSATVVNKALDLGITFIDTADVYDNGHSEEYLGRILKGKRHQVLIATKFAGPTGKGANDRGGSRYHMTVALEASLRRLQTDYVDLYQIHFADPATPIEETLRALDDAVRAGKVRYIGCSNFAAWQLCEAMWTSRVNHLNAFVSVQPQYNLLARETERELVPCCQAYGVGVIPYSPLGGGFLTGKYHKDAALPANARLAGNNPMFRRIFTDDNWNKVTKLEAFAAAHGHKLNELAIAWLLARPWLSTIIAGARNVDQLAANIAGASWKLTPAEVTEVDAITEPPRG